MDACDWKRLFDRLDTAKDVQAALASLIEPDHCPWVQTKFPDEAQAVMEAVARRFSVNAGNVQIVGSGRFGRSLLTLRRFAPGRSDLDVAVIDAAGFDKHAAEWTPEGPSVGRSYLAAGILRPDLFSQAPWSRDWQAWTEALSQLHRQAFREITVTMYRSLTDLRVKQQYALYRLGMARALAARRGDCPSGPAHDALPGDAMAHVAATHQAPRAGLPAADAIDIVTTLLGAAPRQVRLVGASMSPGAARVTCRYDLAPAVLPGAHFQSLRAIRDAFSACGLTLQLIPDSASAWSRVSSIGGVRTA